MAIDCVRSDVEILFLLHLLFRITCMMNLQGDMFATSNCVTRLTKSNHYSLPCVTFRSRLEFMGYFFLNEQAETHGRCIRTGGPYHLIVLFVFILH